MWHRPDSGYYISTAPKGLTDTSHNTEVAAPVPVVEFKVENKPRQQLLIVDLLLRVFDEAVPESDTGNSVTHACLIKKNYPVSKPLWNKFTEAAAVGEMSLEEIRVVIVPWPGNHTPQQCFQFQLKYCGNLWKICLKVTTLGSEVLYALKCSEKPQEG